MQASDLRAIAERAATRDYLRARVTTIYGLDEYGVTVPGRTHEARVRTLSRSWHQVGDTVILAAVNGDPQMLVILDAVGVTGGSASPYPPLPPVAGALWPTIGYDEARLSLASSTVAPSSLADDTAWNAALVSLGVQGVARGIAIASDCIIVRQDVGRGSASACIRCIELDGSAIRWTIPQTSDDPYPTAAASIHGEYVYLGATTASGSGLHRIAISDGTISWVLPYFQGPYRSLTWLGDRLYAIRGYQTDCRFCEVDMATGALVRERQRGYYALGYYLVDGAQALASDGSVLIGMRQNTATVQPTSALWMVMDSDLQEVRTIEMRDFSESVVSYQQIPRLREGRVWTCGGTLSEGGGWLRAWDYSTGARLVNVVVERGELGAYPLGQMWAGEDYISTWQYVNQFSPAGIRWRTYTYSGSQIATWVEDGGFRSSSGPASAASDARAYITTQSLDPAIAVRETSSGVASAASVALWAESATTESLISPWADVWGGDASIAHGRLYYIGWAGSGARYIRRIS